MKGMALWKSGQPTAAGTEFLNVIQKLKSHPKLLFPKKKK